MSDDAWPRGIKVTLADDEEIVHCVHCDRYADASPLAHPACLVIKKGAPRPGYLERLALAVQQSPSDEGGESQ